MTTKLNLYLIRHAKAFARGKDYPDDTLRPLTLEGKQQAEQLCAALQRLEIRFDAILSSPWVRAIQTAQGLESLSDNSVLVTPELADDNFPALLMVLRSVAQEGAHIAMVGHQPWLEQLASWLVTGKSKTLRLNVKKASVMKLGGVLNAGKLKLHWLVPPVFTEAIRHVPTMEVLDIASLTDALEDFDSLDAAGAYTDL